MIIVKIKGGLGNQMFQYAMGISFSLDTGKKVFYDINIYNKKHILITNWPYALSHFNTNPEIVKLNILSQIKKIALELLTRIDPDIGAHYFRDSSTKIRENAIPNYDNMYLDGYWQNEKYFIRHADKIRSEFKIITPIDDTNRKWIDLIQSKNSVCVHIRRGDYVTDPRANKHHGTCSPEYYENAIKYVRDRVETLDFFVFSDDIEWVKENISIPSPCHYMEHNGPTKNYEDLRLMSNCKYFIIANSSFSWWGAWLGTYPEKIVIAPQKWVNDPNANIDIIPDSWIKL